MYRKSAFIVLILIFAVLFVAACDPDDRAAEPTVPGLSIVEEETVTATTSSAATPVTSQTPVPQIQPSITYTPVPTRTNCTPRTDWQIYTVQRGDSLSQVAGSTGSSINELTQANCLVDSSLIYIGQQLYVPNLPPTPNPTTTPGDIPEFVSFTASIQNAAPGQQIVVSWVVNNAPNGVLMRREMWGSGTGTATAPEDFAMLPDKGSLTFTANSQGFRERYILIAYADQSGGRYDKTLDVEVTSAPEPEITAFSANLQTMKPGDTITLTWNVQNAESIRIFYYGSELDHNQNTGFVPDFDAGNVAASGTMDITIPDTYNHPGVKFVLGANSSSAHRESVITVPFEP